jgi:endo-1,4-beta-D-glucanase Y
MYGFAHLSTFLDKMRQKKAEKLEIEKEAFRLAENVRKQAVRDEKLRESMKRREEIQKELKSLEMMKMKREKKNKLVKDIFETS